VRLADRLLRRTGYWEGLASGAAVFTTSYGSPDREAILPNLSAWAQQENSASSVVFAALLTRIMLFSQGVFQWQAKDDGHLFGTTDLALLEEPWPGGSTPELLARMEQDVSLAGNAYIWKVPGEDLLVRLRPDWTTIVSEVVDVPGGGQYRRVTGYFVKPPNMIGRQDDNDGVLYPADEVAHWAPVPDPLASFRGMSWLTPAMRDIRGDDGLAEYKVRYLQNAASPNLLIRYTNKLQPGTIDAVREQIRARYGSVDNAFKTMVLDQGADATVIGNSLQQMDFATVAAGGQDRILADSGVPGVLCGLEPLRGAGRGYQESMQKFGNLYGIPQWKSVAACLSQLVPPPAGNRLVVDKSGIEALQDGELERGQAALVRGQTLLTLRQAGYTRESAVIFVDTGDVTKLVEDPNAVLLTPSGGVQHMLGQAQPGATAEPLPPGSQPRLPLGSVSPGDGGNNTRPIGRPAPVRRALVRGR
jgi:phage portal protein BeeE